MSGMDDQYAWCLRWWGCECYKASHLGPLLLFHSHDNARRALLAEVANASFGDVVFTEEGDDWFCNSDGDTIWLDKLKFEDERRS